MLPFDPFPFVLLLLLWTPTHQDNILIGGYTPDTTYVSDPSFQQAVQMIMKNHQEVVGNASVVRVDRQVVSGANYRIRMESKETGRVYEGVVYVQPWTNTVREVQFRLVDSGIETPIEASVEQGQTKDQSIVSAAGSNGSVTGMGLIFVNPTPQRGIQDIVDASKNGSQPDPITNGASIASSPTLPPLPTLQASQPQQLKNLVKAPDLPKEPKLPNIREIQNTNSSQNSNDTTNSQIFPVSSRNPTLQSNLHSMSSQTSPKSSPPPQTPSPLNVLSNTIQISPRPTTALENTSSPSPLPASCLKLDPTNTRCLLCSRGYHLGTKGICGQLDPNCVSYNVQDFSCLHCLQGWNPSHTHCN